jgi:PAS domain S-box-containing protein
MRQRLFLLALLALLPLVAIAVGLTVYSLRQQQAALRTEATHHASDILGAAEQDLLGQVEILQALAASPRLDGPSPELADANGQLVRFSKTLRRWDVVILADLDGQQIANTRFPIGTPLPKVVDEETYRRVIETREPAVTNLSGPGPFANDRTPRISIRVPVIRDGAVRYVLTAVLMPERLSEIVKHGVDPRWRSFLVDASGRIAASGQRPEIIGQRPSEQTRAALAAANEGIYEGVTLDGMPTVTAFRRSDRLGWSAHVAIPRAVYNAPLTRSLWTLGASISAALALTLLFVEFLRREALRREKMAAELKATEKRFQLLGRATQDAVWDWDFTANSIVWNDALLVLFGYTKDEVDPASTWRQDRIHPEDRERVLSSVQGVIEGERSNWAQEYRFQRSDGTYAEVLDRGYVMRDKAQNRRPVRMVGAMQDQSERKKAERALRESENRYRLLADNTNDMVIRSDLTALRHYVSPASFDILGYRPEELVGTRPTEFVHPDDEDALKEKLTALGQGAVDRASSTHRFRHKDGSWVWVEANFRLVRSSNGTPQEVVSSIRDISERHRHLEAIEAAKLEAERIAGELQLRDRSLAAIGQGVVITDAQQPDNPIIYVNAAFERLSGYSAEELQGRNCRFLQGAETDKAALLRIRAAIQLGRGTTETLVNYRKDGSAFLNQLVIAPVQDGGGKLTHFVGVQADVTDYKTAQEALEHSQRELRAALEANRAILDHSQDVICTIDEHGAFTEVSPQALKAWGYLPHELIGRRYMELVHPEDHEKTVEIAEKIMAGVPTTGFENRYIRRDGTAVPILWSAVWSDEHKTMFCVARDLSERLQLEEQLRQSQKMEAVGQLTGGIAHDFNNLLTVILGNAEMLAEDPSDPALTYTLAQQILTTAERGADLNQKLLAFGRRQSLKPERLNVREVVETMVPILYRTLGEHIELSTEHTATQLSAMVDRSLFESALLNLAVNARDAMPQGGRLTITTGQRTAQFGEGSLPIGQDVVFVTVSDTGSGMTPEVKARVFEPFFTTKEVGKGSGLGLSMVFGFAQQSAGHVSIQSEPGQGTAVTLVLPAVVAAVEGLSANGSAEAPRPLVEARVLLVEDEPQVLQFATAQLVNLGCEVTAVSNGRDALDLLEQEQPFDILFTDVVLPKGMSGVELAMRARKVRPELKVVLTSGYPEEVFEQHGRPAADTPLLHKPYRRKELVETLREVLESASAAIATNGLIGKREGHAH